MHQLAAGQGLCLLEYNNTEGGLSSHISNVVRAPSIPLCSIILAHLQILLSLVPLSTS